MKLFNFLKPIASVFVKILWPAKIENEDIMPEEGAVILVSNHISDLDPVLYLIYLKRQVHFMAKQELFKNKLFSKFFYAMGAFPIKRGAGDKEGINMGLEALENGHPMGIFAEGKRSKTGELLPFKSGVAVIAHRANAPIVTAAIKTKNQKIRIFRKVTITFGRVIQPEELGIVEGSASTIRSAVRMIREDVAQLLNDETK